MSADFTAGVFTSSTWHRLETVAPMPDADAMIAAGESSGAWPVSLEQESLRTESGLEVSGASVVGTYADGQRKAYGAVGGRYTALAPEEWRETIRAACEAGARPDGAFALRDGTRPVACLSIGNVGAFKQYLTLVDSYDGSMRYTAGSTSIRVVCANTLAMFRGSGKGTNLSIRHTASINDRVAAMRTVIGEHIESGEALRALYERAERTDLSRNDSDRVLDLLFPPAPENASQSAKTRAENRRTEAVRASARAENHVGNSLATLWNGATWTVDRDAYGNAKKVRGAGSRLDAMLSGSRGDRVEEIRCVIETLMADGSVREMSAPEASSHGVDERTIGAQLLASML